MKLLQWCHVHNSLGTDVYVRTRLTVKDTAYGSVTNSEGFLLVLRIHSYACDLPIALKANHECIGHSVGSLYIDTVY